MAMEVEEPLLAMSGRRMMGWRPDSNTDWDSCWKIGQWKWRWCVPRVVYDVICYLPEQCPHAFKWGGVGVWI